MTPSLKAFDLADLEWELNPLANWAHQCHGASVKLVQSGLLEPARVARGICLGVGGQHSWVVLGDDPYDPDAQIIDPTLWSYDENVNGVWVGDASDGRHRPHGQGSIWEWGRPDTPTAATVELTPSQPWSDDAQVFLDLLGPLDRRGWTVLAHAPVGGWPAAEIITAMCESGLEALIPVDIVGMLTTRLSSYLSPGLQENHDE